MDAAHQGMLFSWLFISLDPPAVSRDLTPTIQLRTYCPHLNILKNGMPSLKWTWKVSPQTDYAYVIESLKQQTTKCSPLLWASEVFPMFKSLLRLKCCHSSKLANISCLLDVANEGHSIRKPSSPSTWVLCLMPRTAPSQSNIMQATCHFRWCNNHIKKKKVERNRGN